jgi:hypothetical protein
LKARYLDTLVGMLAAHEAATEGAGFAQVSGTAVKTVYERGLSAWPGHESTTLTREQWGKARVRAFLSVAADPDTDSRGYRRDLGLLSKQHPLNPEHGVDPWYDTEAKRHLSTEQRHRKPTLPGSDTAWPIGDRTDLQAAVRSFGRAKPEERDKVKRWIIRRARELDAVDVLPDSWNVTKDAGGDTEVVTIPATDIEATLERLGLRRG